MLRTDGFIFSLYDPHPSQVLERLRFLEDESPQSHLLAVVVHCRVFKREHHPSRCGDLHLGSPNRSEELRRQRLLHRDSFAWVYPSLLSNSPTENKHPLQQVDGTLRRTAEEFVEIHRVNRV